MEYILLFAVFILLFALYLIRCKLEDRKKLKRFRKRLYEDYGEPSFKKYQDGRMEMLAGLSKRKKTSLFVDDITWNDLDMDRIFQQMDFTLSSAGEEALYSILRNPLAKEDELEERDRITDWFMEHADERVRLQLCFAKIGRTGKYTIYDYVDYLDKLEVKSNAKHLGVLALMAFALILCFFKLSYGLILFVILLCYNLVTYMSQQEENAPFITTFEYFLRLLNIVKELEDEKLEVIQPYLDALKEKRRGFSDFARFSWLVTGQNATDGTDILLDYLKMGFHINLIKFNQMLREAKEKKEDILFLIETMGYLEAMLSIGCFRASLSSYAKPVFDKAVCHLDADGLYHCLIEEPVSNSVHLKSGMLLTGSNASGKSTFLKTVAIAQIMAQTIYTVPAKAYATTFYRVYSSMALRDDLAAADSYFIVEIKSLKRIIDHAGEKELPVMCFVDEVLRGTNTVERIAASAEILDNLAKDGVFCFAATHDIELTSLLNESYENYHFEETIENNDVKFNYLLRNGKATSRNAIRLLGVLGYENKITKNAEKRAERFLERGEWS